MSARHTSFITSHPSLVVCSAARATELCTRAQDEIRAVISISDPPPFKESRPPRHVFESLLSLRRSVSILNFRDTEDATLVNCPDLEHIERIVRFSRDVDGRGVYPNNSKNPERRRLLVHCFAGRSRSTTAAFIMLCDKHGAGNEGAAMTELLTACERAPLPNMHMCRLADGLLRRDGALVRVAQEQNDNPRDAECEHGRPVTGTALLAAIRRGEL